MSKERTEANVFWVSLVERQAPSLSLLVSHFSQQHPSTILQISSISIQSRSVNTLSVEIRHKTHLEAPKPVLIRICLEDPKPSFLPPNCPQTHYLSRSRALLFTSLNALSRTIPIALRLRRTF